MILLTAQLLKKWAVDDYFILELQQLTKLYNI